MGRWDTSVYAVVRRYATASIEEMEAHMDDGEFDDGFRDWEYKPSDYDRIYEKIMEITDGDHEVSADAASWCELATVGEIYEFREGEIEIMEID